MAKYNLRDENLFAMLTVHFVYTYKGFLLIYIFNSAIVVVQSACFLLTNKHMDITRLGGLACCTFSSAGGFPSLSAASMLIEELAKGSNEMVESLRNVEMIAKAQVLSKLDSAKRALSNANSSELDDDERRREIERAWHTLESCYYELTRINFLSSTRAEVAFYVAMCHSLLNRKNLAMQWTEICISDYTAFAESEIPTKSAMDLLKDMGVIGSGFFIAGVGATIILTGGVGLLGYLAAGSATVGGLGTLRKQEKRDEQYAKQYVKFKDEQRKAEIKASETKKVLAEMKNEG